jgi:hypothetical protein
MFKNGTLLNRLLFFPCILYFQLFRSLDPALCRQNDAAQYLGTALSLGLLAKFKYIPYFDAAPTPAKETTRLGLRSTDLNLIESEEKYLQPFLYTF